MKKLITILSFICLFTFPSLGLANFDTSLKYGSKGDNVIELQDFLTQEGVYTGKLDGRYGFGTLNAVKAFQTANGLKADGYFGKGSRAKADEIIASLLSDSNATEQEETGTITAPVVQPPAPIIYQVLPPAPIINNAPSVPQSMKDITIENITPTTQDLGSTFKFKVTLLDDNGAVITNGDINNTIAAEVPAKPDFTGFKSYFGFATNYQTEYTPIVKGDIPITFSYVPLGLSKTITITVK